MKTDPANPRAALKRLPVNPRLSSHPEQPPRTNVRAESLATLGAFGLRMNFVRSCPNLWFLLLVR